MKIKLKPLNEQVIVVTGASSGIGLATARAASQAGAKLTLVARNEQALTEIEHELAAGDKVMHVVADVGKREDLERVASETINRFGGFDTWINNAGSSVWGRMDEVKDEDVHRVMQTNFWGTHYGSSIAVRHLRNKGGALINIGSLESAAALPLHAAYSASKHAVKAMTDSLRVELARSGSPVSVTLVRPPAINTLFNDHAKSYLSSAPTFPPPVYSPEVVARSILDACEHPRRDIYIGNSKMFTRMVQLAPRLTDMINTNIIYDVLHSGRRDRHPQGSLHNADVRTGEAGQASGDYPGRVHKWSLYAYASRHPLVVTAVAAAAVTLAAGVKKSRQGRH